MILLLHNDWSDKELRAVSRFSKVPPPTPSVNYPLCYLCTRQSAEVMNSFNRKRMKTLSDKTCFITLHGGISLGKIQDVPGD